MITASQTYSDMLVAPARELKGRVELYDGSTLLSTFNHDDALVNFSIDRAGEPSKFFGYGICQRLTVTLLDKENAINITRDNKLEVAIGVGSDYIYPCPCFFVEQVSRDENTITVTAYDAIYQANFKKLSSLTLPNDYTIEGFTNACATELGMPIKFVNVEGGVFGTLYEGGAVFNGTETIRDALNDVAEATQTIYYMNNNWELTFRRLDKDGEPVLHVDREQYYTLNNKEQYTLTKIVSVTDVVNSEESGTDDGAAQYIRSNAFWRGREDIQTLLDDAIAIVGGVTINAFDLDHRGHFLLEPCDKISYQTKEDQVVHTYMLNDVLTYNGGLKQHTQWQWGNTTGEDQQNPSTLREALSHTYVMVDTANKRIEAAVSETTANSESIANIVIDIEAIGSSVSKIETNVQTEIDGVNEVIDVLENRVDTLITPEGLDIAITERLQQGVDSVTTTTGYTFGADGLTVSKSDSDISTQITEDGMTVTRGEHTVLTANNEGVVAEDLHATTYLIIGGTTRFEDFTWNGEQRCGAFWIGG